MGVNQGVGWLRSGQLISVEQNEGVMVPAVTSIVQPGGLN